MMARPHLVFPHGDHRRARQGCKCQPCRRALALHQGTAGVASDELRVTCWCEMHVVVVPAADVRNGLTTTCGAPGCRPPAEGIPA
jgi:hypothetical protein